MMPVVVLLICPDLFKRVQNLQLVLEQKENPLRCVLPGLPMGPGILVGASGGGVSVLLVVLVNSRMDLCLVLGFGAVGAGAGLLITGAVIIAVKVGSAILSPFCFPIFALHSRSRRFLGRLYPQVSFLWKRVSVVWFLPRSGQLFLAIVGMHWSSGWYVVMRNTLSLSSALLLEGVKSSSLVFPLARTAASLINSIGYFLLRKCPARLMTCLSKSLLVEQMRLIRKNWLYGMLSLHRWGCAES